MIRRPCRPPLVLIALALGASACASHEDRGHHLYAERGCAVCHGATGRGDGPSAKRLDTPPRDLADVRSYRQGSTQDDIGRSIRRGSGAMPAFTDISEAEARDIGAWLVSLQQRSGAGSEP